MPISFSHRRIKTPNVYPAGCPAAFMRDAFNRSRLACEQDHPKLRWIWRIRDAWLRTGKIDRQGRHGIPKGAIQRQRSGRNYPPFRTKERGLYPQYSEHTSSIYYAIVSLKSGKAYVGRTIRSPYLRFQEHRNTNDFIGVHLRSHPEQFVIVILEQLPTVPPRGPLFDGQGTLQHVKRRENAWIHKLDTVDRGFNSRVEISAPPRLLLPSHGFGRRPIRRSRHAARISANGCFRSSRRYLSRDYKRRVDYLNEVVRSNAGNADKYVAQLKPKTVLRMIRYMSQLASTPAQALSFQRLRLRYLGLFPNPAMPVKTPPRLLILGFTSALANAVPLRGILMRANILSLLPPCAWNFRSIISQTVPGFKYGETTDRMFLNGAAVGRETERDCKCICKETHWKKYAVLVKDGSTCVVTTDTSCLRNSNAEAVLRLQAGFRFDYASPRTRDQDNRRREEECDDKDSFAEDIECALLEHVYKICDEVDLQFHHVEDWFDGVMFEVFKNLEDVYDGPDYLPLTGHIDFTDAFKAFKKLKQQVVISRVDKAANCLCIMCKACYIRIAEDEVNGTGYETVMDGTFEDAKRAIIERQISFLDSEHLPAPLERFQDLLTDKYDFRKTHKQPTRYLLAKLHKVPPAFRSITTCFGTTTEGAGKLVHACLAGMLPTLHTLWREAGISIGLASDGCWITQGGAEVLTILTEADRLARSRDDSRPHLLETYDFVAMYTNIPLQILLIKMRDLLDLVFDFQLEREGKRSISIRYAFKDTTPFVPEGGARFSAQQPIPVDKEPKKTKLFVIGRERLYKWIEFVLVEGFMQFGPHMYRQASGIFMGSSPAPDFANFFAFMHEYTLYLEMIEDFKLARDGNHDGMYPLSFIEQFGTRTKRYIDDIITVSLASQQGGLRLEDVLFAGSSVFQGEMLGGMYDRLFLGPEGDLVPTSIALTQEQVGPQVHFLDMLISQDSGGTQVDMFDKRDEMPSLSLYRRFPHCETLITHRSKYSVLHSHLCRFAVRCTKLEFFERAAAKLISDMRHHHYEDRLLSNRLHNFLPAFIRKSRIYVPNIRVQSVQNHFWYMVQQRVWRRVHEENF